MRGRRSRAGRGSRGCVLSSEQPLTGNGHTIVSAGPAAVWAALLDAAVLQQVIPGAETVEQHAPGAYRAALSFGVGKLRGRYATQLRLSNVDPPHRLDLAGNSRGRFGQGWARAHVTMAGPPDGPTEITWRYDGGVSGMVAYAGRPLLQVAAHLFVERFFTTLAKRFDAAGPGVSRASPP